MVPNAKLREKGIEARYLFGVDDYDPLDEIPAGKGAHFEQFLGQPIREIFLVVLLAHVHEWQHCHGFCRNLSPDGNRWT